MLHHQTSKFWNQVISSRSCLPHQETQELKASFLVRWRKWTIQQEWILAKGQDHHRTMASQLMTEPTSRISFRVTIQPSTRNWRTGEGCRLKKWERREKEWKIWRVWKLSYRPSKLKTKSFQNTYVQARSRETNWRTNSKTVASLSTKEHPLASQNPLMISSENKTMTHKM